MTTKLWLQNIHYFEQTTVNKLLMSVYFIKYFAYYHCPLPPVLLNKANITPILNSNVSNLNRNRKRPLQPSTWVDNVVKNARTHGTAYVNHTCPDPSIRGQDTRISGYQRNLRRSDTRISGYQKLEGGQIPGYQDTKEI